MAAKKNQQANKPAAEAKANADAEEEPKGGSTDQPDVTSSEDDTKDETPEAKAKARHEEEAKANADAKQAAEQERQARAKARDEATKKRTRKGGMVRCEVVGDGVFSEGKNYPKGSIASFSRADVDSMKGILQPVDE